MFWGKNLIALNLQAHLIVFTGRSHIFEKCRKDKNYFAKRMYELEVERTK
jgi:hypothetical protein